MNNLAGSVLPPGARRSIRLDRVDFAILQQMEQSALLAGNSCWERTGVPQHQITSRIRKLEKKNVLRTQALLNIDACGQDLAHFYIRVSDRSISQVARDVARLPATLTVAVTRRNGHILASARVSRQSSCHDLIEAISLIEGVSSVSSEMVLRQIVTHINHTRLETLSSAEDAGPLSEDLCESFGGLLDELDTAIVTRLQKDSKSSNRKIAEQLGVSEGAIRYRLKKLQERNLLRFVTTVDPNILGLNHWAWLKLDVSPRRRNEVIALLKDSDCSKYIAVTTGSDALVCLTLTGNSRELNAFIDDELLAFEGVRSVSAAPIIATHKFDQRWGCF